MITSCRTVRRQPRRHLGFTFELVHMNETTLACCESDFKVYLSAAARQRISSLISRSPRGAYPRTTPVHHRGLMQNGSTVAEGSRMCTAGGEGRRWAVHSSP